MPKEPDDAGQALYSLGNFFLNLHSRFWSSKVHYDFRIFFNQVWNWQSWLVTAWGFFLMFSNLNFGFLLSFFLPPFSLVFFSRRWVLTQNKFRVIIFSWTDKLIFCFSAQTDGFYHVVWVPFCFSVSLSKYLITTSFECNLHISTGQAWTLQLSVPKFCE